MELTSYACLPDMYVMDDDSASRDFLRELMSYEIQCESACPFGRNELGRLMIAQPPTMHWSRQVEYPWAARESHLQPDYTCLDVGTGMGSFKYALAKRCREVICVDTDRDSLLRCTPTLVKLGITNLRSYEIDCRDMSPIPDSCVDRVFCLSVLEHVREGRDRAIREMVRVLKPGGALLVSLDLALTSPPDRKDFFIDLNEAGEMVRSLGIEQIVVPGTGCIGVQVDESNITCMLLRYVKPKEE